MSEMREELERLRRDVNELLARLPATEQPRPAEKPTSEVVNEAFVRHVKENMARDGKKQCIGICRIVVITDEHHTSVCSGLITSAKAADFRKPTKLRATVGALASDPLAIRAVRRLVEPFFDGQPMRMTKVELAAALEVSEAEVEASLLPLVADNRLRWSKTATGEESYEIQNEEPHLLLIQSLE
jgi:hypothetical protein